MVFRENKEKFENQKYKIILNGEQINRFLEKVQEDDIVILHDIEEIMNEAVEVR